ncbi:MAG TPA: hypothetical protein VJP80_04950 [Candidatus Saccharimonadales bacterium]|nr:hypothetical protein [Candidatus Saccharimonadales bacterium]
MRPNKKFLKQPRSFWAQVRLISITLGYSRGGQFKTYTIEQIIECLKTQGLSVLHLADSANKPTPEGALLVEYFQCRAKSLDEYAKPNFMNRSQAKVEFDKLHETLKPTIKLPLNKQKGDKKHFAYLTGIVNMLTAENLQDADFDPDPRRLTVITTGEKPLRTFARRVDGAYPSAVNPLAIWEIKEYYGTKTFGSRVADGVYETMLDGYEIEELRISENIEVGHYLIVDDYFTWWSCGKSYLCRMVDMVHEGFVDEVIFGRQVLTRWPEIVKSWRKDITMSTVEGRERLLRS